MATLQVNDTAPRVQYTASGGQTVFSYPFAIFEDADLKVYHTLSGATPDDTNDLQTLTTHYTVSGAGTTSGGDVTLVTGAAAGDVITIERDIAVKREGDYQTLGDLASESFNDDLDKLVMMVQQQETTLADRVPLLARSTQQTSGISIEDPVADKCLQYDSNGNIINGPASAEIANAQTYANNASTSASNAATSESNAATSETNAAASAVAAQAAVDQVSWNDVVYKAFADSPITLDDTYRGKMIAVDTSGGNVVINFPTIASSTLAYTVGVKKNTSDGNTITCNRGGTDTFDSGDTSFVVSASQGGRVCMADIDQTPDNWQTTQFGPAGGNKIVDQFTGGGVDFTEGVQSAVTLSADPGSINNIDVHIGGVYEQKADIVSLVGTTLTIDWPAGSYNAEVKYAGLLSIGVPADGSVGTTQLADDAITLAKLEDNVFPTVVLRGEGAATGSSSAGSDVTRILNTEAIDTHSICTLASNQFTLPAGTYKVRARAPAYRVNLHRAFLYNITDAAVELLGANAYAFSTNSAQTESEVNGEFTIATTKTFELRHYTQTVQATNGMGRAVADGRTEVYSEVILEKVA